jgi:hypothetical protein
MRKFLFCLFILLPFVCLAQESDTDSRLKALEEDMDQLKRDAALSTVPELTQNLDWGKGWSWSIISGNQRHSQGFGIGIATPAFIKSFRTEGQVLFMSGGLLPEPITYPDLNYWRFGITSELRGIWTSPLYFNFSRLYGGMAVNYQHYWGYIAAQTSATDFVQLNSIMYHLVLGLELFQKSNMSLFFEYTPELTSGIMDLGEFDKTFWTRSGIYGGESAPELKVGVRFYLK